MDRYPLALYRCPANQVVLVSILVLGFTLSASGAAFLKLGDIKGESQTSGHVDEIDVLSWSWGMSRSIDGETGSTRSGTAQFAALEITKVLEKSTPKLLESCATGNILEEATLTLERNVGGAMIKYLVIEMTGVFVSSVAISGTEGEDRPTESVSLNFDKVEVTYTVLNADGSPGDTVMMSWDLSTNTP